MKYRFDRLEHESWGDYEARRRAVMNGALHSDGYCLALDEMEAEARRLLHGLLASKNQEQAWESLVAYRAVAQAIGIIEGRASPVKVKDSELDEVASVLDAFEKDKQRSDATLGRSQRRLQARR